MEKVLLHLLGTVGSPLGVILSAEIVDRALPETAAFLRVVVFILVAVNLLPFTAALTDVRHLGPLRISDGSGGLAGFELREALRT